MGDEPVTADWLLTVTDRTIDSYLSWRVTGPTSSAVWEVAWSIDSALPRIGDPAGEDRDGDSLGMPRWVIAGNDGLSLAVGYRDRSAFGADNHWFNRPTGLIAWQPLWRNGGSTWATGAYPGGSWRLAASPNRYDTAFADAVAAALNAP